MPLHRECCGNEVPLVTPPTGHTLVPLEKPLGVQSLARGRLPQLARHGSAYRGRTLLIARYSPDGSSIGLARSRSRSSSQPVYEPGGREDIRDRTGKVSPDWPNAGNRIQVEGQGNHPNSLLKNNGNGTFDDVTEEAGLLSFHPTQAAAWFDYNLDGWVDLFIGNETTPGATNRCELYRNRG